MSRAFVTDKEDWIYCAKAGERCMYAESGKPCNRTSCEFFDREAQAIDSASGGLRIVSRRKENAVAKTKEPDRHRPGATKKSSLPKPRKWGGRNG